MSFDEWRATPVPAEGLDPAYRVGRASVESFPAIYGLLEEAFERPFPRALHDWMYRDNPFGPARCNVVHDRKTGELVAVSASWPWPMARGSTALSGVLSGDSAVAPAHRGRGIGALRLAAVRSDPLVPDTIQIGWPNAASIRSLERQGRSTQRVLGPYPTGTLALDPAALLRRRPWTRPVSPLGRLLAMGLRARERRRLPDLDDVVVEEVSRFDNRHESLAARLATWPGYWCPHGADFLNWRYLRHPAHTYAGLALSRRECLLAYAVVREAGRRLMVMELVAPPGTATAAALLGAVIRRGRAAGAQRVTVLASADWPHWPLLSGVGFLRTSGPHLYVRDAPHPHVQQLDHWMLTAGDHDQF